MLDQLPFHPVYTIGDGRRFPTVHRAAAELGRVTVRRPPIIAPWSKPGAGDRPDGSRVLNGTWRRPTFLVEVDAVLPDLSPAVAELAAQPLQRRRVELDELVELGVAALRESLAALPPSGLILLPHSAGYDTRTLSALLWAALVELEACVPGLGARWARRVRLLVWEPEIEAARRIMAAIGWPDSLCVELGVDAPHVDYFAAPLLDWGWLGRVHSEPGQCQAGAMLARWTLEQAGDWPPAATVSGIYGDVLAWQSWGWRSLAAWVDGFTMDGPPPWHESDRQWLMPYLSSRFLRDLVVERDCGRFDQDVIKVGMCRRVCPAAADLNNPRHALAAEARRLGRPAWHAWRDLSLATKARMVERLRSSAYGRAYLTRPGSRWEPPAHASTSPAWREYLAAAIVDELAAAGVELAWEG